MNIFEFLKFTPKAALFLFPLVLAFFAFAVFSFFKKQKKEPQPAVSPLASSESPPSPSSPSLPRQTSSLHSFLLILTVFLLLLSIPLAVLLVKQKREITMRAEEVLSPTPTPPSLSEEPTPTPLISQCERIKVYDQDWVEISYENLSQLSPEQMIKITVREEEDGNFDKGRIRINNIGWGPEDETTNQKPESPGEFYIECEIGMVDGKATACGISVTLEDEFKIEGEVHDAITNEWR